MKKLIIVTLLLVVVGGSSSVYIVDHSGPTKKVPRVSEAITLPYFIDTFMKGERERFAVSHKPKSSKESKLIEMGFSAKTGTKGTSLAGDVSSKVRNLYRMYDQLYPNNQFVSFGCIDQILKRTQLSFGSVQAYIGNIPEDRIDSMYNFHGYHVLNRADGIDDLNTSVSDQAALNEGYGSLAHYDAWQNVMYGRDILSYTIEKDKQIVGNRTFFIIAPAKYFRGKQNLNGTYGTPQTPDPIVLSPVHGGWIIVTAW